MFEKVDALEVAISKNTKGDAVSKNAHPGHCLEKITSKGALSYVLVGKKTVSAGVIGVGKIMTPNSSFCPPDT